MENIEEIEIRLMELFQKGDDLNADIYTVGALSQRLEFFAKLRDLILEKESSNDTIAADVLGWAYERLSE
jgi:hypothetical protein